MIDIEINDSIAVKIEENNPLEIEIDNLDISCEVEDTFTIIIDDKIDVEVEL